MLLGPERGIQRDLCGRELRRPKGGRGQRPRIARQAEEENVAVGMLGVLYGEPGCESLRCFSGGSKPPKRPIEPRGSQRCAYDTRRVSYALRA
jgi:hypothetical protein